MIGFDIIRTLTVRRNDAGQRLDKFLTKTLINIPKSLLYKYFRLKSFKVNGVRAGAETVLCEGDVITLYISDEFFPGAEPSQSESKKYSDTLLDLKEKEIIYEDENIIIIDKPRGETVHPASPEEEEKGERVFLIDRVIGYLFKKGEYIPENEQSFTPSLCHRLDRNTGGLIICAKNAEALRIMNEKIRDREIKKTYFCETSGVPQRKSDVLRDFHYKDKSKNRVYIFKSREDAKRALRIKYDDDIKTVITKYNTERVIGNNALVSVELITGRTHQIRAHMAYIGCPLVGDGKYGISHGKKYGDNFQHLYAYSLEFHFEKEAGILEYLSGKRFTGHGAEFMKKYGIYKI